MVALGILAGFFISYGIMWLAPGDVASPGAIGRYGFWPGLLLGFSLALGAAKNANLAVAVSISSVLGLAVALAIFICRVRDKKDGAK